LVQNICRKFKSRPILVIAACLGFLSWACQNYFMTELQERASNYRHQQEYTNILLLKIDISHSRLFSSINEGKIGQLGAAYRHFLNLNNIRRHNMLIQTDTYELVKRIISAHDESEQNAKNALISKNLKSLENMTLSVLKDLEENKKTTEEFLLSKIYKVQYDMQWWNKIFLISYIASALLLGLHWIRSDK